MAKDELDLEEPQDDAVADDEPLADLADPDLEIDDDDDDDEVVATAESDVDDSDDDDDDEEDVSAALPDEDEEEGQASLEEMLAQRAAARRGTDDADDDGDIMSLSSEKDDEPAPIVDLPARATPIKAGEEFVCKSCFLVKPRVQLADEARGFCRDCV
ncbi:MAG: DUF4193 family protein [Actinomycetota bacterium]